MNEPFISRAEAKARGLKRYFTGEPCKRGHISERYIGNECVVCQVELMRRRRALGIDTRNKKATAALRALKELGIEV